MKRVLVGLAVAVLAVVALPALGKGVIGLEITGPGLAEPIVLESDGTTASADRVNEWIDATGMGFLVYGANGGRITDQPPTENLGAEYELTFLHMVPGGVTEIPGSLFPFAEGGALVFVEPGLPIGELETVVAGGWFRSGADVPALLEQYGVDVASIELETVTSPGPQPRDGVGWVIPLVVIVATLVGLWAVGRRPATSEDVAPQPSS